VPFVRAWPDGMQLLCYAKAVLRLQGNRCLTHRMNGHSSLKPACAVCHKMFTQRSSLLLFFNVALAPTGLH
jgi:hypothetical protein